MGKPDQMSGQSLMMETRKASVKFEMESPLKLLYNLREIPPIPITLFVALQHVLISMASALTTSSVVSDVVCADLGHPIRARLFATTLFMQGLCTIFQTMLGVRLPVFQGPSSSFLVPLIALGRNPGWTCQSRIGSAVNGSSANNSTLLTASAVASTEDTSLSLEEKLQMLSGSLMVASLVEVVVGAAGLIGFLLRYIGPITVSPTIALIGLSLFELPVNYAKYNPAIALGSCFLVIIFSLYMSKIRIPIPGCGKGQNRIYMPVFQILPILLAMVIMWFLSGVLTVAGVFPDDPDHDYYYSRTDSKMSIVRNTPWFQIIYPGQFGIPSINTAATIGFGAAVVSSIVESVGDYIAAAKCCQVVTPPDHAMSRGILVEGIGSVLSGTVGAAHATTSYSGNIALLSLTKTVSRSVLVVAGAILILLSLLGKVGAAMATLPPPILGGILLVVFGLLGSLGISTLHYVDMKSNRNLLVIGTAFISGLSIPYFVRQHGDMINTGNLSVDQVIRVVLGTPMFVGGVIALILDNTAPGTDLERGFVGWRMSHSTGGSDDTEAAANGRVNAGEPDSPELGNLKTSNDTDTADDVYAFRTLKGRVSSRLWGYIPFLPPNIVRTSIPPNRADNME